MKQQCPMGVGGQLHAFAALSIGIEYETPFIRVL